MLEPVRGKDSVLRRGEAVLNEANARAVAVMRLSQHKLELATPAQERELLAMLDRVKAFRAEGSVVRRGDQPRALKLARKLLEADLQTGAAINREARVALTKLAPVPRPDARFAGPVNLPDVRDRLIRLELTADELLPYLFHLDDCRRDIARFRDEDRKLLALILTFGEKDRFELVRAASFAHDVFHIDTAFIRKDKELDRLNTETTTYRHGSKEWREMFEKRVKPVFVEQARAHQRRVASYFADHDRMALASLAELQKLQDEYERYVVRTAPDFKYRLRPAVPPDEKPLAPLTFTFDFSEYVEIESGVNSIDGWSISYYERVKPLK